MNEFWESNLPVGYYDKVLTSGLKKIGHSGQLAQLNIF